MAWLRFEGKSIVRAYHDNIPTRQLVPDKSKSVNPAEDDNLIIHGDNLHALKALLPRYAGSIDCICLDPPYNIKNEAWIYSDNVDDPKMQEWLKNKKVDGKDMQRHDKWVCMMGPPLIAEKAVE